GEVAESSAVLYETATVRPAGFDSLTVIVTGLEPVSPSSPAATSAIDSDGVVPAVRSSSTIVTVATPFASVAFAGVDSVTVNVSSFSTAASAPIGIVIVRDVCPTLNVSRSLDSP